MKKNDCNNLFGTRTCSRSGSVDVGCYLYAREYFMSVIAASTRLHTVSRVMTCSQLIASVRIDADWSSID